MFVRFAAIFTISANGDPDSGIKAGTRFEDLPEDWTCRICGAAKDKFEKE